MKTIEELGRRAKRRSEKYRNLSDADAGRQVKLDYPGEYDDFNETGLVRREEHSLDIPRPELPQHAEKLDDLYELYKPSRGVFTSWWQSRKTSARTNLVAKVTEELAAVIEQGALLEAKLREKQIPEVEYRMFLARNALELSQLQATSRLIQKAADDGHTLETDQHLKKLRGESNIRTDEHDRTTQINLDRKLEEARETVRLAMLSKSMSEHQGIAFVQDLIDLHRKQISDIRRELSDPALIDEMIRDREEIIETLVKDRRARQDRLLQADNG